MRVEDFPVVAGGVVCLVGALLVADAWLPESARFYGRERRRRVRTERHALGEAMVGLGIAALGAAVIGRDGWRWTVVAAIVGGVLVLVGAVLNFRYLRETFAFRGRARRGVERGEFTAAEPADAPRSRIR